MADYSNEREHVRYCHEASVMYSNYSKNPYCYYGAKMCNCSLSGMYLESNYALPPGSIICIKRAYYLPDTWGFRADEDDQMTVVWCRKLERTDSSCYGVGIRHVDPAGDETKDGAKGKSRITIEPDYDIDIFADLNVSPGIVCENRLCKDTAEALRQAIEIAESRTNQLAKLNHFATAINSTLDVQEVLQVICREMVQIFNARNAGIGLLDQDRTKIKLVAFHAASSEESDVTGLEMPLAGNAATLFVIETGQPIVVPDVQNNPLTESFHDVASNRGTHCIMIVPLMTRGEVIGTIGMPTADTKRLFTRADVSLAQTIASQISNAIENSRLYAETVKARDLAERDLEIGREIQAGFFPEKLPVLPGWEILAHFQAARQVAGDFYDVFKLGNGQKIGLVIGDVCDKGVGAALFMALFRSFIRAFATDQFADDHVSEESSSIQPSEILKNTIRLTNNYIAKTHSRANMFATLFFGILDPETGVLDYINCGHEAPVLIGKKGILSNLNPDNPAVGMFPDLNLATKQVVVNYGEILFTCTDGVTDAQNPVGEFFTKERLLALLDQPSSTAVVLLDSVRTEVHHHIAGTGQFDDITMMAVRRMEHA